MTDKASPSGFFFTFYSYLDKTCEQEMFLLLLGCVIPKMETEHKIGTFVSFPVVAGSLCGNPKSFMK